MSVIYKCRKCRGSQMTFMRYTDVEGEYDGKRDFEYSTCRCTDYWNMEKLMEDYSREELIELGFKAEDLDSWKPKDDGYMLDNDDLW